MPFAKKFYYALDYVFWGINKPQNKCENVYFTPIILAYCIENSLTNHSLMNLSQILGANN